MKVINTSESINISGEDRSTLEGDGFRYRNLRQQDIKKILELFSNDIEFINNHTFAQKTIKPYNRDNSSWWGNENQDSLLCEKLVEADLSPCIQLIPKIISIYKWEEKLNESGERNNKIFHRGFKNISLLSFHIFQRD